MDERERIEQLIVLSAMRLFKEHWKEKRRPKPGGNWFQLMANCWDLEHAETTDKEPTDA